MSVAEDLDRRGEALRTALAERFAAERAAGKTTKRNALRLALLWAIRQHAIEPGERLPSEAELTRILGVSLGTVQSALGQLQDLGVLVRRRGDGTRLASAEPLGPTVWHFRFRHIASGLPLRTVDHQLELMETTAEGEWSEYLGRETAYTLIRRQVLGDAGVRMGAEMYLKADDVPVSTLKADELRSTNIRVFLEKELGLQLVRAGHLARLVELTPRQAALFDLSPDAPYFRVGARVRTAEGTPFIFQHIYVPADTVAIEF